MDLFLVACVSVKRDVPAPARDLYISAWFRKARSVVEQAGGPWFILSAKHGLVNPGATIEPYDRTLKALAARERREWARVVLGSLEALLVGARSVTFLAGAAYREYLEPGLRERGIAIHVPMDGMRIGQQLSWLSRQVDS